MKRLFLILLSVLPLVGSAQESDVSSFLVEGKTWRPLVEEGKKWVYETDYGMPYNYDYVLHIEGDTVVDGKACKKLFRWDKLDAFAYEEDMKCFTAVPMAPSGKRYTTFP